MNSRHQRSFVIHEFWGHLVFNTFFIFCFVISKVLQYHHKEWSRIEEILALAMKAEKKATCFVEDIKKVELNLCVETKAYFHGTCQTDHFEQEHLFHLDTQLRRLFLFYKISAISDLV